MNKFVASNGAQVVLTNAGLTGYVLAEGEEHIATAYLDFDQMKAWREFAQHERDEELGRWRWPENPEWVVYSKRPGFSACNGADLLVVNEVAGASMEYARNLDDGTEYVEQDEGAARAARAYFEAHPERKPWHDATDGHLWLVRFDDFPETDVSALVKGGRFVYNDHCHEGIAELSDRTIVDARRIWPES